MFEKRSCIWFISMQTVQFTIPCKTRIELDPDATKQVIIVTHQCYCYLEVWSTHCSPPLNVTLGSPTCFFHRLPLPHQAEKQEKYICKWSRWHFTKFILIPRMFKPAGGAFMKLLTNNKPKKLLQKHRCCLNKSCAKEKEKQRFTERWKRFEIMCD